MATRWSTTRRSCPGWGTWTGASFFSALTDIRYDGRGWMEVEDRAYEDSLEARQRALIQSRAYLRQFIVG